MRQAMFGTDVRGRAVAPNPATWQLSGGESALVVAPPTVQIIDGVIVARMSVTNPTDQVVSIVVNPFGGTFPYGGDSPFTLGFGPSAPVTYTGQRFPPAPPVPIRIDFPPDTQVTFEATIRLERWAWSGTPTVRLEWGFHFASGTAPGGDLSVALPLK
jgi:hypothetical protein